MIRRVDERLAFENRYVSVYDDDVEFRDGSRGSYLRIEHRNELGPGVVLVPLMGDRVCLVKTFRYPLGQWQWAFPRGFGQGVDIFDTARVELAEEVGAATADLALIGWTCPDSGLLASKVAVIVAKMTEPISTPLDMKEVESIRWIPLPELVELVVRGGIEDGFTLSALLLVLARGETSVNIAVNE